jgi:two-component system response regulator HydG
MDFPFMKNSSIQNDPDLANPAQLSVQGDVSLLEVEKAVILNTLAAAGGNKSEAARRLGITRKTLHKKLKAYGVMP